MKLTTKQLRQIVAEELQKLSESWGSYEEPPEVVKLIQLIGHEDFGTVRMGAMLAHSDPNLEKHLNHIMNFIHEDVLINKKLGGWLNHLAPNRDIWSSPLSRDPSGGYVFKINGMWPNNFNGMRVSLVQWHSSQFRVTAHTVEVDFFSDAPSRPQYYDDLAANFPFTPQGWVDAIEHIANIYNEGNK